MARNSDPAKIPSLDDLDEFPGDSLPAPTDYHPAADKPNARHEAAPEDVLAFIEDLQGAKEFTVTIYRIANGAKSVVDKLRNIIPDNHELGIKHGPGEYQLVFSWTVPNRKTPDTRRVPVVIAPDYKFAHDEYVERQRQTLAPAQSGGLAEALDMVAKMAPMFKGNSGGGDSSVILEIVRSQSADTKEMIRDLKEQLREDRKENAAKFEKLLEVVAKSNSQVQKVPTIREQLEELQGVQKMLGIMNGTAAPEDNRPVWLQAVDQIGERVFPLIETLMNGNLMQKAKAGMTLKKELSTPVGQKLMSNQPAQTRFIGELLAKADTDAKRNGVLDLAAKLGIPVPAANS